MERVDEKKVPAFFSSSRLSTFISVVAGVSFMFTCMLLPLVAKSGSTVEHSRQNRLIFTAAATATLLITLCSVAINIFQRRILLVPLRPFPIFILAATIILLIASQFGWLSI